MNADYREWLIQDPCPWCRWRPLLRWEWKPRSQRFWATLTTSHYHASPASDLAALIAIAKLETS